MLVFYIHLARNNIQACLPVTDEILIFSPTHLLHICISKHVTHLECHKSPPLVGITSMPVASLLSPVTAASPPISIGALDPSSPGVEVKVAVVKERSWLCHACTYKQDCVPGSRTCVMCNTTRRRLHGAPQIFFGESKPPIVRPGGRGKLYCPNCRLGDWCNACLLACREKCLTDLWTDADAKGPLK